MRTMSLILTGLLTVLRQLTQLARIRSLARANLWVLSCRLGKDTDKTALTP